jgi:hypothetical protein
MDYAQLTHGRMQALHAVMDCSVMAQKHVMLQEYAKIGQTLIAQEVTCQQ